MDNGWGFGLGSDGVSSGSGMEVVEWREKWGRGLAGNGGKGVIPKSPILDYCVSSCNAVRGEIDEPMVDLKFNEEEMDDGNDVWDEDDEWLMALVTPLRATVNVLSTYMVGGQSMATPIGYTLAIMAPRVATQPQKMEAMGDAEVSNSIAIGEIHPRVATVEGQMQGMTSQVQTMQTVLHGAKLQNQQLQTRVAEIESREATLTSYMLWMEERLTVLEKRLPGPPLGP
nr:hypothetical protein [Tanacetum cinerariifolium]